MWTAGRLLFVAADDAERAAKIKLLEDQGLEVVTVTNGRDALHWLVDNATPAGIVILGSVARLGGWELLAIARSYHRLSRVPALIVTKDPIGPLGCDVFACLPAPATDETFLRAVSQMLDSSHVAVQ